MSHSKRYKLPTSTKKDTFKDEAELNPFYTPPLKTTDFTCEVTPPSTQEEKKEIEPPRKLREIDMFSRVSNTKVNRPKLLPPAQRLASARYQTQRFKVEDTDSSSLPSTSEQQSFDDQDVTVKIEPTDDNLDDITPTTSTSDFAGFDMEVKDEKRDKEEEAHDAKLSTICLTQVKIEKSDQELSSTSSLKTEKKARNKHKLLGGSSSEKIQDKKNKPKVHKIRMRIPKKVSVPNDQPSLSQSPAVNLKLVSSASNQKIKYHTQTSLSGSVKSDVSTPSVTNSPDQKPSVTNFPKKTALGHAKLFSPYKRIKLTGSSDKIQKKSEANPQKPSLAVEDEIIDVVTVDEDSAENLFEPTFSKKRLLKQKENKVPKKEAKQKLSAGEPQKLEKCDHPSKKVTGLPKSKRDKNTADAAKKRVQLKTLTKPKPKEDQPAASTSKQKQIPETEVRPKSRRFNITLSDPAEDTYPEYNYNELLMASQKENSAKDEPDELEKQLEEIFGGPSQTSTNISDLGRGYDNSDPFIDDSMPCDEVIPEDMTTEHGGFYVNSGKLTFRQVEGFNSDSSDDSDYEELPKAKKMGKVSLKDVKHKTTRRLPAKKSQYYKQKEALKKKKELEKKKVTLKELRKGLKKL